MINSIVSVNNLKSAFLASYYYSQLGTSKAHGFNIGYSFIHSFNDHLIIRCGVRYDFNNVFIDNSGLIDAQIPGSTYNMYYQKNNDLDLGLGIFLYGLTIGLSNNIMLSKKFIYQDDALPDSTSTSGSEYKYLNILAKYDFKIREKFTITPQFDYNKIYKSYLSIFLSYLEKYKIGLTYHIAKGFDSDNKKIMISSSCLIADKIEIILFFNPGFQKLYDSKTGWNLSGKIGLKF